MSTRQRRAVDGGPTQIHIAGSSECGLSRTLQKRRRRRNAVEPKIRHLKGDNRLGRCFLRALTGDAINAVLGAPVATCERCFGDVTTETPYLQERAA